MSAIIPRFRLRFPGKQQAQTQFATTYGYKSQFTAGKVLVAIRDKNGHATHRWMSRDDAHKSGGQIVHNDTGDLYTVPVGQSKRVRGFLVNRTGNDQFRIEKEGGKGYVAGGAKEILEHIDRETGHQELYGKKKDEALARAEAFEEPDWTNAAYAESSAKAFARLPVNTPVVSLDDHAGTHGRTGRIVKDDLGRNRVKLDGEDGYSSNDIEPMDANLSWRKPKSSEPLPDLGKQSLRQPSLFEPQPEEEAVKTEETNQEEPEAVKPEEKPPIAPVAKKPADKPVWQRDLFEPQEQEGVTEEPRAESAHPIEEPKTEEPAQPTARKIPGPLKKMADGTLGNEYLVTHPDGKQTRAVGRNAADAIKRASTVQPMKMSDDTDQGDIFSPEAEKMRQDAIGYQPEEREESRAAKAPELNLDQRTAIVSEMMDKIGGDKSKLETALRDAGHDPAKFGAAFQIWSSRQRKPSRAESARPAEEEEPQGWTPENHVKIAADSIEKLRGQDVFRLLDSVPKASDVQRMASYIRKNRPDLSKDIHDAQLELEEQQASVKAIEPAKVPVDELVKAKEDEFAGKKELGKPEAASELEASDRKPDQAVVNVPLAKRGDIDAQIDKYKSEQSAVNEANLKAGRAQEKTDKKTAQELFDLHGDALAERTAIKAGTSKDEALTYLKHLVSVDPAKALLALQRAADESQLAEDKRAESAREPNPLPSEQPDEQQTEEPTEGKGTEGSGSERLPQPVDGGTDGRSDSGTTGRAGNHGSARPRIITSREGLTKQGDVAFVPESMRPHLNETQQQGVALAIDAMTKHGGFLLADGTGLGKTREQLAIAQHFVDQGKKVIIVSPAEVIKPDWKKGTMTGSFAADSQTMGINAKLVKGDEPLNPGTVHVTTYNELAKLKDQIDGNTVILYDESHQMKNRDSARHKHGKEASDKAGAVLYATATPGDKPLHIAHLARAGVFGNVGMRETYEKLGMKLTSQVVHGGKEIKVWKVDPKIGYREALRRMNGLFDQMTRDGLMVKRELSMDGVDFGTHHITLSDAEKQSINDIYQKKLDETRGNKAVALMAARLHQEPFKIPATVKMIQDELAAGRSPVVFLGRVNDIDNSDDESDDDNAISEGTAKALRKALIDAGVSENDIGELHGGATKTADQKKKAMSDFQSGKKKIMIATVQSGGTGINLDDTVGDRPRTVIMMTPPFTANDMAQAVGRVHRLNTKSDSKIRGVLANTDIDEWNARLLNSKFKTMGAIVGGETLRGQEAIGSDTPVIDDDLTPFEWGESLHREKARPPIRIAGNTFEHKDAIKRAGGRWNGNEWEIDPRKVDAVRSLNGLRFSDKPERTPEPPAPMSSLLEAHKALIGEHEPLPPPMSDARREAIHNALRHMAGMDEDRARERNDVGFNKMDSDFGSKLAELGTLTDKQAHAAARMLAKYHRQIDPDLMTTIQKHDEQFSPPPPSLPKPPATMPAPAPSPTKTHYTVAGNTFAHKDDIRAAGGKWNPATKTWTIPVAAKSRLDNKSGLRFLSTLAAEHHQLMFVRSAYRLVIPSRKR